MLQHLLTTLEFQDGPRLLSYKNELNAMQRTHRRLRNTHNPGTDQTMHVGWQWFRHASGTTCCGTQIQPGSHKPAQPTGKACEPCVNPVTPPQSTHPYLPGCCEPIPRHAAAAAPAAAATWAEAVARGVPLMALTARCRWVCHQAWRVPRVHAALAGLTGMCAPNQPGPPPAPAGSTHTQVAHTGNTYR